MVEKYEEKLFWGWGNLLTTDCIACRPDLTLEGTSKKTIILIDTACASEYNKVVKPEERLGISINYALD